MKIVLGILIFFIVLAGGGIFYLTRPKNLGITYTQADLKSIYGKLNVVYEPLPANAGAGKTLIASGAHPVDQTFTSQELTAAADNRRKQYIYFPFRHVQIRVNPDGSVEGTATVPRPTAAGRIVFASRPSARAGPEASAMAKARKHAAWPGMPGGSSRCVPAKKPERTPGGRGFRPRRPRGFPPSATRLPGPATDPARRRRRPRSDAA